MSTNYVFSNYGELTTTDVLNAVRELGLTVHSVDDDKFSITDGKSFIWCYTHYFEPEDVEYVDFVRYGNNYDAIPDILIPIARHLGVSTYDEHDPEYDELKGFNEEDFDVYQDSIR